MTISDSEYLACTFMMKYGRLLTVITHGGKLSQDLYQLFHLFRPCEPVRRVLCDNILNNVNIISLHKLLSCVHECKNIFRFYTFKSIV